MRNLIVFESTLGRLNEAVEFASDGELSSINQISVGDSWENDHFEKDDFEEVINDVNRIDHLINLLDSPLDLKNKPPKLIFIVENGGACWFKLMKNLFPNRIFYGISALENDDEGWDCTPEEPYIYVPEFHYNIFRTKKMGDDNSEWDDGFFRHEATNQWLEINDCRTGIYDNSNEREEPIFRIFEETVFNDFIEPQFTIAPDPEEVPIAEKEGYEPGLYMKELDFNCPKYKKTMELPQFDQENSFIIGHLGDM
ncbi:hypothetical protein N9W69_03335 [Flavobacteriaceae bacterium]|nr:hypothetical protein [Flavobacteriaceae bacterium]